MCNAKIVGNPFDMELHVDQIDLSKIDMTASCPGCMKEFREPLLDGSLSHPVLNEVLHKRFRCDTCCTGWDESYALTLLAETVEIVK